MLTIVSLIWDDKNTHEKKQTNGIVWIKIAVITWMHISCLIYYVLKAVLFWEVFASFRFFLLIINSESHSVVFLQTNEKRLQNQAYRQIKSKLMDTFGSGKSLFTIWKGWPLLISFLYLHFLNLNNILTLPQTSDIAEAWFDLTQIIFPLSFCLPDLHACALIYEIKTNASRL